MADQIHRETPPYSSHLKKLAKPQFYNVHYMIKLVKSKNFLEAGMTKCALIGLELRLALLKQHGKASTSKRCLKCAWTGSVRQKQIQMLFVEMHF